MTSPLQVRRSGNDYDFIRRLTLESVKPHRNEAVVSEVITYVGIGAL
jgi:hypothetical protein